MDIFKFTIFFFLYSSWTSACQTRYSTKSPVLELKPLPPESGSALIWVVTHSRESIKYWKHEGDTLLKPYLDKNKPENMESCKVGMPPSKGKFCEVKIDHSFAPCTSEYGYGYDKGTPCIFLRLNGVPKGWTPQFYNSSNIPSDLPEDLKYHVRRSELIGNHQIVWVSCDGENAADKENIGPLIFFPQRGFSATHLLNTDVKGYLPPVMAVVFERPLRGIAINIICIAWAANIPRDPDLKLGSVHFVLLVD